MESCLAQVLQKDVGKRLQVGQELIDYFSDKQKSADLEHDQTMLDKLVDGLATSWVNSSNYKVSLALGGALEGGKAVLADQNGLEKIHLRSISLISRLPTRYTCKLWEEVGKLLCGDIYKHLQPQR